MSEPVSNPNPEFEVIFAGSDPEALKAAQHLRYQVFVRELGSDGPMVDHEAELECDRFDPVFEHMLLLDRARTGALAEQCVGVYRLLSESGAAQIGQFYTEDEYDLTPLLTSGRRVLELGRSCLHPDYRGGAAMYHLWTALGAYIEAEGIEVLFGVASFHGTDAEALAAPLALLHERHLAPQELRVRARAPFLDMSARAGTEFDRRAAMLEVPALIKAYLRLGGFVGEGAYLDHAFKTTDVCLVLDMARMNDKQRRLYAQDRLA